MIVHVNQERIRGVLIRGHGGAASGRDLVCAAVSAAAQTSLQGLLHYAGGSVRWRRKKGELRIELEPEAGESRPEAEDPRQVLLRTLVMGVQSIAREHPDRVQVRVRGSGKAAPPGDAG